ncbi:MAG: hypothetical protein J3Q66DRAFT_445834 [Benniella sp.]|nr:MAG: hypothetical protein J3Q66DRAFT_445834 [Benniella sp.]
MNICFGPLPPIPTTDCHNDPRELKDGPKEFWQPSLVGNQINMFVKTHSIEALPLLTTAALWPHQPYCYVGLTLGYFILCFKDTPGKTCYVPKSVFLLRKYISLLDLPFTMLRTEALMPLISRWLGHSGAVATLAGSQAGSTRLGNAKSAFRLLELLFVNSLKAIIQAKGAMEKHGSQMMSGGGSSPLWDFNIASVMSHESISLPLKKSHRTSTDKRTLLNSPVFYFGFD